MIVFTVLLLLFVHCGFISTLSRSFYILLTVHPNIMIVFIHKLDAQILYSNTFITFLSVAYREGGVGGFNPLPPKFRRPS